MTKILFITRIVSLKITFEIVFEPHGTLSRIVLVASASELIPPMSPWKDTPQLLRVRN